MDATELRRQLRSILADDVYQESPAGDQDFLEDFEMVVRDYQLAKERAALAVIKERACTSPDFNRPLPGGTFPWLDGIKQA